jgi:hypothetical protein
MDGHDASMSWGDVAGAFWPAGFDFNGSHSIGASIIAEDEASRDIAVADTRFANYLNGQSRLQY